MKIKPCPFAHKNKTTIRPEINYSGTRYLVMFVICPVCNARGPKISTDDHLDHAETKAIKAWNERK